MKRTNLSSGAPWEAKVGYSRAVRVGPHVYVSGTTAINESGHITGTDDPYVQTLQSLKNVANALDGLGASMKDVVRSRMFVTNIEQWETIGRAHAEYFREIMPATTMVEVSKLIHPAMLVEIEVDAIVGT